MMLCQKATTTQDKEGKILQAADSDRKQQEKSSGYYPEWARKQDSELKSILRLAFLNLSRSNL
jgi:hypothetical protein